MRKARLPHSVTQRGPSEQQQQAEYGRECPDGVIETTAEVFVATGQIQPHEERDPQRPDHDQHQGDRQLAGQEGHAGSKHLSGHSQVGDRGEQGGEDADSDGPGRKRSATQEEIGR